MPKASIRSSWVSSSRAAFSSGPSGSTCLIEAPAGTFARAQSSRARRGSIGSARVVRENLLPCSSGRVPAGRGAAAGHRRRSSGPFSLSTNLAAPIQLAASGTPRSEAISGMIVARRVTSIASASCRSLRSSRASAPASHAARAKRNASTPVRCGGRVVTRVRAIGPAGSRRLGEETRAAGPCRPPRGALRARHRSAQAPPRARAGAAGGDDSRRSRAGTDRSRT